MTPESARELVYRAAAELNQQLAPEKRLPLAVETVVAGEGSRLDSLALINLCASVERMAEGSRSVDLISLLGDPSGVDKLRTLGSIADLLVE